MPASAPHILALDDDPAIREALAKGDTDARRRDFKVLGRHFDQAVELVARQNGKQ